MENIIGNLSKEDFLVAKRTNIGVIISKDNKWMYEGGIYNNKCSGEGMIYCTFQQYKTGTFKNDRINGFSYKMSINWGEITQGESVLDQKIG